MMSLGSVWEIIKATFKHWSDDNASEHAAALAYYTIFSLAPLLIIVIAIAGFVFGERAARGELVGQIQGVVGPTGAQAVQQMLSSASTPKANITATLLGVVTLLAGSMVVFTWLKSMLNTIWGVKPKSGQGVKGIVKGYLMPFVMVLGAGSLLLASLVLSVASSAFARYLGEVLDVPGGVWVALNAIIPFIIVTILFAMIFKVLPDVVIRWSDVWVGAIVTALMFTVGKFLIGLYLSHSNVASAYGAAGSLIVLLLWIYYSAQILFLGAEFTQAYACRRGTQIRPSGNAVLVS